MKFKLDENKQFLFPLGLPVHERRRFEAKLDELLLHDNWPKATALTLIVCGCSDAEAHAYYMTVKPTKSFPEWAYTLTEGMARANRLADSSISAGALNDPDTPANWIAWARAKGYSTAHLEQQATPQAVETTPDAPVKAEEPAKSLSPVIVTDYAAKPDSAIINSKDVRQWLQMPQQTLNRRIKDSQSFPKPFKDGGLNKWEVGAIRQYIDSLKGGKP